MFPFAACQLETAQFITTGDICAEDLWFIPDLGRAGWHFATHNNFVIEKHNNISSTSTNFILHL
jgi:hypothetical protein